MDGTERGDPNPQIGQAERVYKLIITDPTFKLIVQLVFMLAVTFYGIGYLMGVSQFSQGEVIGRVVKIGVIYLFIGANGWFWFDKIFVQFFKEGTDYLAFLMATSFDTSPELQNALAQNDFYDKSVLFSSIDNVFGIFFSDAAQKKIAALLFASIFGWAYLFIIYMAFLLYVYAVANAVLLYLTSQVFISILFVIGPIFFIFLFFKQTQDMFDKWLQQLIGFSLQQIFLLTTLAFFNMMMYEILKLALGYRVCWDDVLVINKPVRITLLSFWTLASLPPRGTLGPSGINSGVPSIFSILFIWVIASLMKQFITFMTDLAASIGGGVKASDMGSGVKEAASKAGKAVGEQAGDLWKKHGQSRIEKLDRHLFDSGRLADKDRADKELENKTNQGHKRSMVKSGEDAARQHSILHKDKLAGMSKEDQQKELNGVRDKAMNKKGKELGLNEKEVEALKKDKGLKYTGDTVIGAAAAAIKQAATKGGSIRTAIKDKDADIDSSRGDMKKALQSTDAAGREKIMKGIKSGRLGVKKKSLARAKSAAGSAATQIAVKGVGRVGLALAKVATLGQNKAVREAYNKTKTTSEKEFAKAKGQLEKNGDISKRRAGLGRFRKEAETDQIRARMKENIAASKPALSNNRVEEVAFAQQQSNVAAELESGKGGSLTRKAGIISAVIGREKKMTQGLSLKRNEDGKVTSVQTAKGEKRDAIKEDLESDTTRTDALQEQKAAADTKMQAADDSSASAQKEVTENLGGDSMVDFAKSLEEKKGLGIAQFIPGSKTRAKKKELSSKMDEMVGTGEYESASGVVPGVVKAERMKDKLGAAQYVPFTKTRAQKHKLNDMITEGKSHNDYGKHIESSKNANEGARVASNYKAQSQGVKSQIDKAGGGSIPKQENTSNAIPERNLEVASAPSLDESQKPSAPSREPSSDNRPPPVYESDDEK
jgi:type IV secretion system protein VirB6